MYVNYIILDCIHQLNENRSISGVYHLLTGKKSIQSVQDASIFQLERYYGIVPGLSRGNFDRHIVELVANQWLQKGHTTGYYLVTNIGSESLLNYKNTEFYSYIRGMVFSGKDQLFLQRLYLLIQTYSNKQHQSNSFIPIIDNPDVTSWIRSFYQRNRGIEAITSQLFTELHRLLATIPNNDAELFVDRFSGYKHYGMSIDQLAEKYGLTTEDTIVYLTAITHQLLATIDEASQDYPLLVQLQSDLFHKKFITKTANKTYQLFINGYRIEQIATLRELKVNTIYDHMVEIALYDPEFKIEPFVSIAQQQEIIKTIKSHQTFRLKTVKENCDPSISYFQIRLVLARWKERMDVEGQDCGYE